MKVLLAEKERELERLQLQHQKSIEQARRAGEMQGYERATKSGGFDAKEMNPQGYTSGYGADPQQYELMEHYKVESTKTRMEVESIKNMLYEIQSQNKVKEEEERQRFETNKFDPDRLKNIGK